MDVACVYVLRRRKTKQKGESPSVIKGPDAHTEEYGLYSEEEWVDL